MAQFYKRSMLLLLFSLVLSISGFGSKYEVSDKFTLLDPLYDNLYIASGDISINAKIKGDLLAAAGKIAINDTVVGDLLLCAGDLFISGQIKDDLRAAAGKITVTQTIRGDAIVFGGDITFDRNSIIYGDLIIFGGEVRIDGIVLGNIVCYSGELEFNGRAEGQMTVKSGKATINGGISGKSIFAVSELYFGSEAQIFDDIQYWSSSGEIDLTAYLIKGNANFDESLTIKESEYGFWSFIIGLFTFSLVSIFTAIFVIGILLFLAKESLSRSISNNKDQILKSFAVGVIYYISLVPLMGILFLSIVGIPIALLISSVLFFSFLFGPSVSAFVFALWLDQKMQYHWNNAKLFIAALVIYLALWLLALVPIIGWLVLSFVLCTSFGIIILGLTQKDSVED